MTTPEQRILWDVIEEHLAEGAFQLERGERAHRSPIYSLDEVADGPERLLSTHLAGLALTGLAGHRRVLDPILVEPDAADFEVLAVAALWALSSERHEALLPTLRDGSEGAFRALARAVELHPDVTTDHWVQRLLAEVTVQPAPIRGRIWGLAARRRVPAAALSAALRSEDPSEVESAAALLRWAPKDQYAGVAGELARSGTDATRLAATIALVQWRVPEGLAHCRAVVQGSMSLRAAALELMASVGGPGEHAVVLDAMSDPAQRDLAIRAVGFSGNAAAVDRLLPLIGAPEERTSRLAAEAFSLITGFDLFEASHHRPEASTDGSSDEETDESASDDPPSFDLVDALPLIDVSAAQRFWDGCRASLGTDRRYLSGDADMQRALVRALRSGPMRNRHTLALSLGLRSRGTCSVNTGSLARVQREQALFVDGLPHDGVSAIVFNW